MLLFLLCIVMHTTVSIPISISLIFALKLLYLTYEFYEREDVCLLWSGLKRQLSGNKTLSALYALTGNDSYCSDCRGLVIQWHTSSYTCGYPRNPTFHRSLSMQQCTGALRIYTVALHPTGNVFNFKIVFSSLPSEGTELIL